jgi:hypothetical protein
MHAEHTTIHSIACVRRKLKGKKYIDRKDYVFAFLRLVADVVFDLGVVVVIKAEGIVDLSQGETMDAGYFLGVLARLKQQDDMSNACLCSFDDGFTSIEGGIANDIRMCRAFNRHGKKLLSSSVVSVAQKCTIVNYTSSSGVEQEFLQLVD